MRKIAFSTLAAMDADISTIISLCRRYTIGGIEVRQGFDGGLCGCTTKEQLADLRTALKENGVVMTDIASSVCFCVPDESAQQVGRHAVDIAAMVGCGAIRVFLGNFIRQYPEVPPEVDYPWIVKSLKALCAYAADKGVAIWVETHNEFSTGEILKKLSEDVAHPNLYFIWDIMHSIEDGEPIERTWEMIGSRVSHIHIKDGYDRGDRSWHDYLHTPLGEGSLPLASVLDLLGREGYDGYVSFEWEALWRAELQTPENHPDAVLRAFVRFLAAYDENPFRQFGADWRIVSTDHAGEISFTADGISAQVHDDNPFAALKKLEQSIPVQESESIRVYVPYHCNNIKNPLAAYALATMMDDDGNATRRIYFDRPVDGRMELQLDVKAGETQLRLELGIKGTGEVVWYRPMLIDAKRREKRTVRLAAAHPLLQWESYQERLKRISNQIDAAAGMGADLLSFAETINDRAVEIDPEQVFEPLDGAFCTMMRKKARQHRMYLFFTFHELDQNGVRRNTAVLLDREGEIAGIYRKTHLSLTDYERGMVPGDDYPVFDTEFGRVGMLICWDTYFPEPARAMVLQGAEFLLISTAGNPTHRHVARAMENGVYVVVACATGVKDAGICPTKIIAPDGSILAETVEGGSIALAEVDFARPRYINWLSVGPSDAIPANIYRNEYRADMIYPGTAPLD